MNQGFNHQPDKPFSRPLTGQTMPISKHANVTLNQLAKWLGHHAARAEFNNSIQSDETIH